MAQEEANKPPASQDPGRTPKAEEPPADPGPAPRAAPKAPTPSTTDEPEDASGSDRSPADAADGLSAAGRPTAPLPLLHPAPGLQQQPDAAPPAAPVPGDQTLGTVTGTVTSFHTAEPLSGVTIEMVGTAFRATTGLDGRYLIERVPPGVYQIRASLRGHEPQLVDVNVVAGSVATASVRLMTLTLHQEEIIVTGTAYGARRREIGNSIGLVSGEDIEMQPIFNIEDALSARVSGLNVLNASGMAGAGQAIRIRGVNSISQGNAPLIYLDGVRIYNGSYAPFGGRGGVSASSSPNQMTSPLNDINPADIERVEVIKGAAATTLYGTEAAGGVIQIFTKGGQGLAVDGARWNFKVTQGFNNQRTLWGPKAPSQAWYDTYGPASKGLWLDQWLRNGHYQQYTGSVRGRSGNVGYYLSGRLQDDQGVIPTQGANDWTLRGNVAFSPLDKVEIQFQNGLTRRRVDWVADGNDAEGFLLNVMRGPFDRVSDQDHLVLEPDYTDSQTHFVSGVQLLYRPTHSISAQLVLGFDLADQEIIEVVPFGSPFVANGAGRRFTRHWQSETRTIDARANYTSELWSDISSTTSVGFMVFDNVFRDILGQGEGFAAPHATTLDSAATRDAAEEQLREVNAGLFAQEVVGFADKLFITAGLRIDGNSAFGERYGLQPYPKLSGSYLISEEGFWPAAFDSTKLRLAYGESGKAPGFFDAQRVWTPVQAKENQIGVIPLNVGNPDLGPERTREYETGVETTLFNGRLGLDAGLYYQRTFEALVPVRQDPTKGFLDGEISGTQLTNVGIVDNWGAEITLRGTLLRLPGVTWDTSATLSTNRSEVIDLKGAPPIFLGVEQWVREGYPIVSYFGKKVANPDEIADPVFIHDQYIGPTYPTHTWQFSTDVSLFDRLQLEARGEALAGHYLSSGVAYQNASREVWPACFDVQQKMRSGDLSEVTALERWKCQRDNTDPMGHITRADFFRLRYVALTYRLPKSWFFGPVEAATLTLGGSNLFGITGYGGIDPEARESLDDSSGLRRREYYNMPPVRRFSVSLRMSLW